MLCGQPLGGAMEQSEFASHLRGLLLWSSARADLWRLVEQVGLGPFSCHCSLVLFCGFYPYSMVGRRRKTHKERGGQSPFFRFLLFVVF